VTPIRTQAEFVAALAAGQTDVTLAPDAEIAISTPQPITLRVTSGQPRVVAYGSSQPRVVAWGSSQPRVVAWGSSQPRVEAHGSSQPRVEAFDSSQPRVVAHGSSQPRVEAYDRSQPRVKAFDSSQPRVVAYDSSQPRVVAFDSSQPRVEAFDSSQLSVRGAVTGTATPDVAVLIDGPATITGGQQTRVRCATVEQWCAYYGRAIVDGVVVLFKAVGDDYHTLGDYRFAYLPGTIPTAPDWDGGAAECGGGLHFSPRPRAALAFARQATRFIACPVRVTDIAVHPDGTYPEKVKAKGCCAPVYEVDEDGEPIAATDGRTAMKATFTLAEVLSVLTDILLCDIEGVYRVLNFMTGANLFTHQLPRAGRLAAPCIAQQHPDLAALDWTHVGPENWREWLQAQVERFGLTVELSPLPPGAYVAQHPLTELGEQLRHEEDHA